MFFSVLRLLLLLILIRVPVFSSRIVYGNILCLHAATHHSFTLPLFAPLSEIARDVSSNDTVLPQ